MNTKELSDIIDATKQEPYTGMPTRHEIIALGRHDVEIAMVLREWQYGKVNWETAMMLLVLHYQRQTKGLRDALMRVYERTEPPPMETPNGQPMSHLCARCVRAFRVYGSEYCDDCLVVLKQNGGA